MLLDVHTSTQASLYTSHSTWRSQQGWRSRTLRTRGLWPTLTHVCSLRKRARDRACVRGIKREPECEVRPRTMPSLANLHVCKEQRTVTANAFLASGPVAVDSVHLRPCTGVGMQAPGSQSSSSLPESLNSSLLSSCRRVFVSVDMEVCLYAWHACRAGAPTCEGRKRRGGVWQ